MTGSAKARRARERAAAAPRSDVATQGSSTPAGTTSGCTSSMTTRAPSVKTLPFQQDLSAASSIVKFGESNAGRAGTPLRDPSKQNTAPAGFAGSSQVVSGLATSTAPSDPESVDKASSEQTVGPDGQKKTNWKSSAIYQAAVSKKEDAKFRGSSDEEQPSEQAYSPRKKGIGKKW